MILQFRNNTKRDVNVINTKTISGILMSGSIWQLLINAWKYLASFSGIDQKCFGRPIDGSTIDRTGDAVLKAATFLSSLYSLWPNNGPYFTPPQEEAVSSANIAAGWPKAGLKYSQNSPKRRRL